MGTGLILFSLCVGTAFNLLASLGLVRMPDLFMRMQAVTKSATLGTFHLLAAAVIGFWSVDVLARALLAQTFIVVVAPAASQIIARAAFRAGTPLWSGTRINEFRPPDPEASPPEESD